MDETIRTFDIRKGEVTSDSIGASLISMDLTRDQRSLLLSGMDSIIRFTDNFDGSTLNTYQGHSVATSLIRLKLNFSNDYFAVGSEDGGIYLFDLLKPGPIKVLSKHTQASTSIDISENDTLVSGSLDGSVCIWKKRTRMAPIVLG
jgi:mitogen-activated protein kinase organizer 1